jgi:ABC-2 type transport system permease protein
VSEAVVMLRREQSQLSLPGPTRVLFALYSRDIWVLRKDLGQFLVRVVMQPLLFTFVFAYVFPKIGQGIGPVQHTPGSPSFATILVPGLIAVSITFQGIQAVALPLVQEFSYSKEIEDRVLAPAPVWTVGLAKILSGATQSMLAAGIVFPVVLLVHAQGEAPSVAIHNPALFVFVLVFASLLGSAFGLLIGTTFEPRKVPLIFSVVLLPITFLGCIYYPWSTLGAIPWLKWAVLANPLVYMSEGLRASLTPSLPHMPVWGFSLALVVGVVGLTSLSLRTFHRRVVD